MIPTVVLLHVMLWANPDSYLHAVVAELSRQWPQNRTVSVVCHGHSVPAGYFRTPVVDMTWLSSTALPCSRPASMPERRWSHSCPRAITPIAKGTRSSYLDCSSGFTEA